MSFPSIRPSVILSEANFGVKKSLTPVFSMIEWLKQKVAADFAGLQFLLEKLFSRTTQKWTKSPAKVVHCTALPCTAPHQTALYGTLLHCTALHCVALLCTRAQRKPYNKTWYVWTYLYHGFCFVFKAHLIQGSPIWFCLTQSIPSKLFVSKQIFCFLQTNAWYRNKCMVPCLQCTMYQAGDWQFGGY